MCRSKPHRRSFADFFSPGFTGLLGIYDDKPSLGKVAFAGWVSRAQNAALEWAKNIMNHHHCFFFFLTHLLLTFASPLLQCLVHNTQCTVLLDKSLQEPVVIHEFPTIGDHPYQLLCISINRSSTNCSMIFSHGTLCGISSYTDVCLREGPRHSSHPSVEHDPFRNKSCWKEPPID